MPTARPAADPAAPLPAPAFDHEPDVTALILRWQSTGDRSTFAALAAAVAPTVEGVAEAELRRGGRHDAALVADASALVLDHLRRLHHRGGDELSVAPFRPAPGSGPSAGLIFVRWLARCRTADVARSQRRRDRHEPTFTRCFGDAGEPARSATATTAGRTAPTPLPPEESLRALADTAHRLGAADRALAEALLAGESQVEIARRLDVSAGTITRRRQRLLVRMAAILHAGDGDESTPRRPAAAVGPTLVSFDIVVAEPAESRTFPVPRGVHSLYLHARGRAVHVLERGGVHRAIDRRPGSLAFIDAGAPAAVIVSRPGEPAAGILVIIPSELVTNACRGGGADGRRPLVAPVDLVDFRDPPLAELVARLHAVADHDRHDHDRHDHDRHDHNGHDHNGHGDAAPSLGVLRRLQAILGVGVDDDETASRLSPADQRLLFEWIDGHLDRPLPLEELAALFRLSVGHFARKVRNTFRMCPSRVVQQRRAMAAIALMKDHERSLSALAARLGFSSQSHFTTMFRRHVGLTPAVFRHAIHGLPPATGRRENPARDDFRAQPPVPTGVQRG